MLLGGDEPGVGGGARTGGDGGGVDEGDGGTNAECPERLSAVRTPSRLYSKNIDTRVPICWRE